MAQNDSNIYFCKLSKNYPQQLQNNFYAGGPQGSSWYNNIQPGNKVFAIKGGKVHKLWQVDHYSSTQNEINTEGSVHFKTLKVFNPPIPLISHFLMCKHFVLDINLLNKSAKQTLKGFYPIGLSDPSINVEAIDFNKDIRGIYLGTSEKEHSSAGDQDIFFHFDKDAPYKLVDILYRDKGEMDRYDPLFDIYERKFPDNDACELQGLLDYALRYRKPNKAEFLHNLISDLEKGKTVSITNSVLLYDNILSGQVKPDMKKRFWAARIVDENKVPLFISERHWKFTIEKNDLRWNKYNDRLMQVKKGDRFLLQQYKDGDKPAVNVLAIGTVGNVEQNDEGLIHISWDEATTLYKGRAPIGPGVDGWEHPLTEVRRSDILTDLFGETIEDKTNAGTKIMTEEAAFVSRSILQTYETHRLRSGNVGEAMDVSEITDELAQILDKTKDEEGMMIGIFGRWGRGKTYLVNKLWEKLTAKKENSEFVRVNFHAWKYQDTPASWAYLYETIAECFFNDIRYEPVHVFHEPLSSRKFRRRMHLNLIRINSFQLIMFCISLMAGMLGIFFWDKIKDESLTLITALGLGSLTIIPSLTKNYRAQARSLFKKYTNNHSYKELLGFQAEIQKELKILLKLWIKIPGQKRIFLFVDDIDRCKEERIIEIVDALRVMLEDQEIWKRVVVITAIDERLLQRAIRNKYEKLVNDNEEMCHDLNREYLDKLFIMGLRLGSLTPGDKAGYYEKLTEGKVAKSMKQDNTSVQTIQNLNESSEEEEEDDFEDDDLVEIIKIPEQYEISFEDHRLLLESILNFNEMTPRQIRILYFRYLLSRRLLQKKLKGKRLRRFMKMEEAFLSDLICWISEDRHFDTFERVREKVKAESSTVCIEELRPGKTYEIDKDLYLVILNVLEIVIAY